MTIDELLDKLDGVTPSGNGWVALCPAHGDSEPSLSVGEGDDRLLTNCMAGCTSDDVLTALGLTWRDVVYNSTPNYSAEPEAVYGYQDEAGNVLFEAVRMPGKKFRQRHMAPDNPDAKEGGWVWNLEGVRRVIYRLPEVLDAIREGRTVYLVEGEKDADRLWAEGFAATCNPMGAGKWRPEYTIFFQGAKQVFIVQDRDEPGRRHAQKVKMAIEALGVPCVIWQAKVGKDASDHFDAGFGISDLAQPRPTPKRGIVTVNEMIESGMEYLNTRAVDAPGYPLIPGVEAAIFRPGRVYVGGAYTGDGKSTIAIQGTHEFCDQALKVGYYTMEMTEADLRNKLVSHWGIPLYMLEQPWLIKQSPEHLALYNAAFEHMREWKLEIIYDTHLKIERVIEDVHDREFDVVMIDHIHRLGFGDRRDLEEQIKDLTNLTLDTNIIMLVLAQLRKFNRGQGMVAYPPPTLQDFRETSALGDEAALAFALWRSRDEQGLSFVGDTSQFRVLKNRYVTTTKTQAGHIELLNFNRTSQLYSAGGVMSETERPAATFTPAGSDPWEGVDDGLADDEWD